MNYLNRVVKNALVVLAVLAALLVFFAFLCGILLIALMTNPLIAGVVMVVSIILIMSAFE